MRLVTTFININSLRILNDFASGAVGILVADYFTNTYACVELSEESFFLFELLIFLSQL